jgi:hypothetical protein
MTTAPVGGRGCRKSEDDNKWKLTSDNRASASTIPSIFFPTSAGVMLDIEQLPALIEGLQVAEAAERGREWLK